MEQVPVRRAVHLHRRRWFVAQHRRHFAQAQVVVTGELLCHERGVFTGQLVGGRRRRRRDGRATRPIAGRRPRRRRFRGVRSRVRGHHIRRRRRHCPRLVVHGLAHCANRVVPELWSKKETQTAFRTCVSYTWTMILLRHTMMIDDETNQMHL